tara:strand:+ start:13 stop:219 length:207 start_codon:yes stop_codon:yes gene_type:complete
MKPVYRLHQETLVEKPSPVALKTMTTAKDEAFLASQEVIKKACADNSEVKWIIDMDVHHDQASLRRAA